MAKKGMKDMQEESKAVKVTEQQPEEDSGAANAEKQPTAGQQPEEQQPEDSSGAANAEKQLTAGQQLEEQQPEDSGAANAEKQPTIGQQLEEKMPAGTESEEHSQKEKTPVNADAEKITGHLSEEALQGNSEADFLGFLTRYRIICRNRITKRIGGVNFTDGVGYTYDGYAASWFAAKDGYAVELAE